MAVIFKNKKRSASVALALIIAIVFASISASIITAAPSDDDYEQDTVSFDEPTRVTVPTVTEAETEAAENTLEIITNFTDNLIADAPEILTEAETEAPETEETEPAEETTPAIPETTVPETTVPETEPENISKSHSVVDESGFYYVVPEMKTGYLADELGVPYTIETPKLSVTEYEITLAATIIQLEVMGNGSSLYRFEDYQEKYWEMCAVAQCIRNRAESGRFPGSIEGVILQSTKTASGATLYQFSPADKLARFTPTEEAIVAAREVLIEGVTVMPSNYYYFCATRIEASFEKNNAFMFEKNADGTIDKIQGHLTTFYPGHK
ncbi:MAG: cell wall hydrolase [Clostridia bacterium]|nr:cell wall hydrolase [Clostridia bacterium]